MRLMASQSIEEHWLSFDQINVSAADIKLISDNVMFDVTDISLIVELEDTKLLDSYFADFLKPAAEGFPANRITTMLPPNFTPMATQPPSIPAAKDKPLIDLVGKSTVSSAN